MSTPPFSPVSEEFSKAELSAGASLGSSSWEEAALSPTAEENWELSDGAGLERTLELGAAWQAVKTIAKARAISGVKSFFIREPSFAFLVSV